MILIWNMRKKAIFWSIKNLSKNIQKLYYISIWNWFKPIQNVPKFHENSKNHLSKARIMEVMHEIADQVVSWKWGPFFCYLYGIPQPMQIL